MKLVEKKDYNSLFYFLAIVIFVAFLIFTISGNDGLIRLLKLKNIKQQFVAKNRVVLRENLALRLEQKSLYNLKVIENVARQSLGLVYPDEFVFVGITADSPSSGNPRPR